MWNETIRKGKTSESFCLKLPSIELVTVLLLIFCTPRITSREREMNGNREGRKVWPCTCDLLGQRRQLLRVQLLPTLHLQSPSSAALAPGEVVFESCSCDCNTWSLLLNISTILASFERPSTLKQGVYSLSLMSHRQSNCPHVWVTEQNFRREGLWIVEHLATRKIPYWYMAHEGDQVVLAQTGKKMMLSGGGWAATRAKYRTDLNISISFTTTISSVGSENTAFCKKYIYSLLINRYPQRIFG